MRAWLGERAEGTVASDPVRDYLKQIGKIPGLTIEQEAGLAQRIEAGCGEEFVRIGPSRMRRREDHRYDAAGSPLRTLGRHLWT